MSENYETVDGMGREALVQFVLFNVAEYGEVDHYLPNSAEVDNPRTLFRKRDVDSIEWLNDGTTVSVRGKTTVKQVVDRIPATRWQPSEVKRRDLDVFFDAEFTFEDEGFGEGRVEV